MHLFSLESQDVCGKPRFINHVFGKPFTVSLSLTCFVDFRFPSDFGQRA